MIAWKQNKLFFCINEQCSFMQTKKDDIRRTILKVARVEFIEKGFKDASMRIIAKKANVGLSNIYNYFKNKDEIFREILSGLLATLSKVEDKHNRPGDIDLYVDNTAKYARIQIKMFVDLIDNYKEDFKLLLFKSAGSSLENFREECIEAHTKTGKEYINLVKQKYPSTNSNISEFFIHTMSSWFMSSIAELVMHDLTHDELEKFITEYMKYSTAGWKNVMNING